MRNKQSIVLVWMVLIYQFLTCSHAAFAQAPVASHPKNSVPSPQVKSVDAGQNASPGQPVQSKSPDKVAEPGKEVPPASEASSEPLEQTETNPTAETNGREEQGPLASQKNPLHASKPVAATPLKLSEDQGGVPLLVGGEEILRFKTTISGFTPEQRVAAIDERLAELLKNPQFDPATITLTDTGYSTDLVCGPAIILTVTDRDAQLLGFKDRNLLASDCSVKLARAITNERAARSPKVIFFAIVQTVVACIVLVIILLLLAAIFPRLYVQIRLLKGKYIRALRIQKAELLSEESLAEIIIGFCRVTRAAATLTVILIFVERVLSFFPTTRQLSIKIVDIVVLPLVSLVFTAITSYLPNLLIIALILTSAYYLITFTNFIFSEIGRGKITIADFDPEWADPTYKITRFLIVAFSLVLIFPYLPGSGSPAFQQISLFLGVLISLGSSGAVSNIVAGVFLTYTGAFKLGDRVKIADTVGDVVERKLLYTRVRTIKDEYITIPNSMVLGAHIINYSASTKRNGLILHTAITIGYDVPWRQVEHLLIESAKSTPNVLSDPAPFVLVTALDDFYVSHEINCYTAAPHMMAVIYGDLHKQILDKFADAGVEIMSPSYYALRKGDHSTIPKPATPV